MLSAALLLTLQTTRTEPLALSAELRKLRYTARSTGVQVGRARAIRWEATPQITYEELLSKLEGWSTPPDRRSLRYRMVGKVKQSLSVGRGEDPSVLHVSIEEEPPEDGTIPPNWPKEYRGGLMRIVPDTFAFLRGIEPHRWETDASPTGNFATAFYRVRTPIATVEREVLQKMPNWKRVEGRDGVRLTGLASGMRSFRGRGIESVRLIPEGGDLLVGVRWYYERGDRAGVAPPQPTAPVYRGKPLSAMARDILGPITQAHRTPLGSFGGYSLSWSLARKGTLDAVAAAGKKHGARVSSSSGSLLEPEPLRVSIRSDGVEAEATAGRQTLRHSVPAGFRATPDYAGFWEHVVVDQGSYVTISVTERRTSPTQVWPKELTYAWPPLGVGKMPLSEMNRQPDHVQFSQALPTGSMLAGVRIPMSARWRFKPSSQRAKELSSYRYVPTPSGEFEYVSVSAVSDGWMQISAQYREASGR